MNQKIIAIAVLSLMANALYAQTVPNAGALLNQYNQESQRNDEPVSAVSQEKRVPFTGFTYQGFTPEEIEKANSITNSFLGKEVQLGSFVQYLEQQLERNFGISVVFQTQPDGKLKAIRPILGAIAIDNQSKLSTDILRSTLERGIELGKPLNRAQLEERSMIANEIPGIQNEYHMAPGIEPGSTDLQVVTKDGKMIDGYLGIDNGGISSVGIWQLSGGLNLNNALGFGEKFSLNALKSENGQYGGFFADAPVDGNDLRVGLNASIYTYSYDTSGTSNNGSVLNSNYFGGASDLGINSTYALSRSEYERSNLTLAYDHKENYSNVDVVANATNGSTSAASFHLSKWLIDVLNLGYNGMRALPNQAIASYGVNLSFGHASQKVDSAALTDNGGPKQQGNYAKLNFQGAYALPFSVMESNYDFTASTAGQLSNKNLPNSEKFYIGGLSMMKAWSPQLTGGDNAIWLELKAEKPITSNIKLGAFAEAAYVSINSTPYTALAPSGGVVSFGEKNFLSDVGLLAAYAPLPKFDIVGTVAVQTSPKPKAYGMPIATTNNQSGAVMGFIKGIYRF